MNRFFEKIVLDATGATSITAQQVIQKLWSGYGDILRVELSGGDVTSAIVKHIVLDSAALHPRGWNTDVSHARKTRSYFVEMNWYRDWSGRCNPSCRVARCYAAADQGHQHIIVLEDLDVAGFPVRKASLVADEVLVCLAWLANFHARFLGVTPNGLWETGTYWHLATRPDELAAMAQGKLKEAAAKIDQILASARYQTIVHGDAKVENFCFSKDVKRVAAVDFQYVGGGCGMKDVAYFLGSCLSEAECERYEAQLLDFYFNSLQEALQRVGKELDWSALEDEWRRLFPVAWADFSRFLQGWMPTHRKLNPYSERLTQQVLTDLSAWNPSQSQE